MSARKHLNREAKRPPKLEELHDPMKVAEVAALLRVGRALIYSLIAEGKLRVIKMGTGTKRPLYLVRKKDFTSWFEGEHP